MRLFIPTLGTELRLLKPWGFPLFHEYRNEKLLEALGIARRPWTRWDLVTGQQTNAPMPHDWVTLPAGTILTVQRIYIRGSFRDFDSVTFSCNPGVRQPKRKKGDPPAAPVLKGRFWAKLDSVNEMEVEEIAKLAPVETPPDLVLSASGMLS